MMSSMTATATAQFIYSKLLFCFILCACHRVSNPLMSLFCSFNHLVLVAQLASNLIHLEDEGYTAHHQKAFKCKI